MESTVVYSPSEHIVCREILDEMIIIPIDSNIADLNDAMFSFNETGRAVWQCLTEGMNFKQICNSLVSDFDADPERIEKGVEMLLQTLLEKGIIVQCKK